MCFGHVCCQHFLSFCEPFALQLDQILQQRERTLEMYFTYAEMLLLCGHIVSKCVQILQIFERMEENP